MNKQSNSYTLIYILTLVAVVGAALAVASMSLASRQRQNADADKMKQILQSVRIVPQNGNVAETYAQHITRSFIVNVDGDSIQGNAFDVNMADQSKITDLSERKLPVYVCRMDNSNDIKYILPVYGAGLWGPIWGYVAVNPDGKTIYGAYFSHQGETPGLGAEIEKPAFQKEFDGKSLWNGNKFQPVQVVKFGKVPAGEEAHFVDGVSGGTITSRGVSTMLGNCLTPYAAFLEKLSSKKNDGK